MDVRQITLLLAFQLFTGVMAIILAIFIYRRNPDYKGNTHLSFGFFSYSLYPFGSFFYELGISEIVVHISIRASLLGTIVGTAFFFLSMTIFCESEKAVEGLKYKYPYYLFILFVCIVIILPSSISFISLNPTCTNRSILLMGLISSFILVSTGGTILRLTRTINNVDKSNVAMIEKLSQFRLALIASLGIMVFSIVENVTQVHFYNVVNYVFLFFTYILISRPLLAKKNK